MNGPLRQPPESYIPKANLQDFYTEIIEYYDELFPVSEAAVAFMESLRSEIMGASTSGPAPLCRFLGIGCGTGILENRLAGLNFDVTGIDINPTMIDTSRRRMKRGFASIRFFEMPTIDMKRFLKNGSFSLIASLGNLLPYIADETLIRKFFYDVRELLAPNGRFVLEVLNLDSVPPGKSVIEAETSSVRVKLTRVLIPQDTGMYQQEANLELGNGRIIRLMPGTMHYRATSDRLMAFAKEAGFTDCKLYGDFEKNAWSPDTVNTVLVFTA